MDEVDALETFDVDTTQHSKPEPEQSGAPSGPAEPSLYAADSDPLQPLHTPPRKFLRGLLARRLSAPGQQ